MMTTDTRYTATNTNLTPLESGDIYKRATSDSFAPVALSYKRKICRLRSANLLMVRSEGLFYT